MTKKTLLFFAGLLLTSFVSSQNTKIKDDPAAAYAEEDLYDDDPYYWSYSREVGVNFTPLISKFVPFNLGENQAGLIGLRFKKYYSSRAFRVNFGANVSNNSIDGEDQFIYLALGLEKRYMITKDKRWAYTSGWDLFFRAVNEDEGDDGLIGITKSYGFEYHYSKRVFLSTEAQLNVALGSDDGVLIEFQLPIAIFVNIRLY